VCKFNFVAASRSIVLLLELPLRVCRLGEGGGFLAQKFNRNTTVGPCTNVSQKYFSRHFAKPMLGAVFLKL